MTFDSWAMVITFVIAFHALLFHAMPRFSRPDILFAVTVPDAFVAGGGRTLISRYRAIVWTGAAAAVALSVLLSAPSGSEQRGWLMMAVVAGNLIVGLSAWLWAHRQARTHALPHGDARVASLVPRDTSLPGGALFAGGPFVILLTAAVLLYAYSDRIPEGGRETSAFGWLAFGALCAAMTLTLAVSLSRRTRQIAVDGMAAAAEQRFRRMNVLMLVLVGYGMAIMISAVTLEKVPAFGDVLSGRLGFMLLPLMLFNFGIAIWMFRVGQGGQRTVDPSERQKARGDATPDHAWKVGGLFYFNRSDPAIWVENRLGFGYTLNMGHSGAWLLMGMMFLPMLAATLFLF